jgi:hypothetical protein
MTHRVEKDVTFEGKLIVKAGDEMTAEDAYQLYKRYPVKIKFTCPNCQNVFTNVNIYHQKIKVPHFRGNHKDDCPVQLENEANKAKEKRRKVKEKESFYSKLINPLDNKKSCFKSEKNLDDDELFNENIDENYKERKTTKEVKDICTQYLKLLSQVKNKNFEEQQKTLRKNDLFLPHAKKNYTYGYGLWNANNVRENTGYRIFHGILGRWISCSDGDIFFYRLPHKFNSSWMPIVVKIPKDISDERYKINWKNNEYLKTHAKVFVYGFPERHMDGAFVLKLEHISFIYMANYTRKDLPPFLQRERNCDEAIKIMVPKAHAQFAKLNLDIKAQNFTPIDINHSNIEKKSDIISNKVETKNEKKPEIKKIKSNVILNKKIIQLDDDLNRILSTNKSFIKNHSVIGELMDSIFSKTRKILKIFGIGK